VNDAERLLCQLQALANPVRLWVVAKVEQDGPLYVSQLAREAGISRPLMKMHLRKLEGAGLVTSEIGAADNGKAANFYRAAKFELSLTPKTIAQAKPAPASAAAKSDGDHHD
jgi:predicted transcriptional regulator